MLFAVRDALCDMDQEYSRDTELLCVSEKLRVSEASLENVTEREGVSSLVKLVEADPLSEYDLLSSDVNEYFDTVEENEFVRLGSPVKESVGDKRLRDADCVSDMLWLRASFEKEADDEKLELSS